MKQAQQYKADLVKKTAEIVASGKELSVSANKDVRKLIDDGMKLAGQLDTIIKKNTDKLGATISSESTKLMSASEPAKKATATKSSTKKPVSKSAPKKPVAKPVAKKPTSKK